MIKKRLNLLVLSCIVAACASSEAHAMVGDLKEQKERVELSATPKSKRKPIEYKRKFIPKSLVFSPLELATLAREKNGIKSLSVIDLADASYDSKEIRPKKLMTALQGMSDGQLHAALIGSLNSKKYRATQLLAKYATLVPGVNQVIVKPWLAGAVFRRDQRATAREYMLYKDILQHNKEYHQERGVHIDSECTQYFGSGHGTREIRSLISDYAGEVATAKQSSDLYNPLFDAIEKNDFFEACRAMLVGHDMNALDKHGCTPLVCATKAGDSAIVFELIRNGAVFTADTKKQLRAFAEQAKKNAIENGEKHNVERFETLLQTINGVKQAKTAEEWQELKGSDEYADWPELGKLNLMESPNIVNAEGTSLALFGYFSTLTIDELFRRGLKFEVKIDNESVPIVFPNHLFSVQALEHGADPDVIDRGGSALMYAICNDTVEKVDALLQYGANPNLVLPDRNIPLVYAMDKNPAIMRLLLQYGADPNKKDEVYKGYPVECAIQANEVESLKLLLEHGANPNLVIDGTNGALVKAIGKPAIVKLLLQYKADPNKKDEMYKGYPLEYAIQKNDCEAVKLLLEYGANPNQVGKYGQTVLLSAVSNENFLAVELLLKYNADPNVRTQGRLSPLAYAVIINDLKMVELLLQAGADPNYKRSFVYLLLDDCAKDPKMRFL